MGTAVVVLSVLLGLHLIADVLVLLLIRKALRQKAEEERAAQGEQEKFKLEMALSGRMKELQLAQQKLLTAGCGSGPQWDALELEIADILKQKLALGEDEFYRNWLNEITAHFTGRSGTRH